MHHIYLADWHYESVDLEFGPSWRAKVPGAIDVRDLRNYRQEATAGGTPGKGLFIYDSPQSIPGALYLGHDPLARMDVTTRNALADQLGVSRRLLPDTNLADLLQNTIYTDLADPSGITSWLPMGMSRMDRPHVLNLDGFGTLISEPFSTSSRAFQVTVDVFQAGYRRHIAEGTDTNSIAKWTGATMLKLYGRMGSDLADILIPPERLLLDDTYQRPGTVLTDTFTDTDGVSLDAHTPDSGGAWVEVADTTWQIQSNKCQNNSTGLGIAVLDVDQGDSDHEVQATVTGQVIDQIGFVGRWMQDGIPGFNENGLYVWGRRNATSTYRCGKYVTGVHTVLKTASTTPMVDGSVLKLTFVGDDWTLYDDTVSVLTLTDATHNTQLQAGLWRGGTPSTMTWDNFTADDNVPVPGIRNPMSGPMALRNPIGAF